MFKPNYKILFHFENDQIEIVEIKRYGIISDDKSKIYYWLLYDKVNDMLSHLVFKAIKTEINKEYRTFEDATLVFDTEKAQFTEKGKTTTLKLVDPEIAVSQKLKEAIGDYILLLNFRG